MSDVPPSSFRFLDLPPEIRVMIYRYYYGNLTLQLAYHIGGFGIGDVPFLDIENTSQLVRKEAATFRESLSPGIIISDYRRTRFPIYGFKSSLCVDNTRLASLPHLPWSQITRLTFDVEKFESELNYWPITLRCLPRLQHVEIRIGLEQDFLQLHRNVLIGLHFAGQVDRFHIEAWTNKYSLSHLSSLLQNRYRGFSNVTVATIYLPRPELGVYDSRSFEMITKRENMGVFGDGWQRSYTCFISGQVILQTSNMAKPMIDDGDGAEPRPMVRNSQSGWSMPVTSFP